MIKKSSLITITIILGLTLLIFGISVLPSVIADQAISNSEDWRDVYSVIMYSNLQGKTAQFLVSDRHSRIITNSIPPSEPIEVFSSTTNPFIIGYESYLRGKGYTATEYTSNNVNIEVARRLTNITSFILIDDAYGYNAISVAPYAVITNSYVIFANTRNVRDVSTFLNSHTVTKLIIYGHVDRGVRDAVATYNPEIINKDNDKFDNNIEIVKRYREINPVNQVIISNGEFMEQEVMSGKEPVLFIGRGNVPEQVGTYLRESGITVAVLIGNNLVGTATNIRRTYGVSTFVKFARSAREPTGAIAPVEGLDLFYVPTANVALEIISFKYNRLTNQIEITIKNTGGLASYLKGTYTITNDEGDRRVVGNINTEFLEAAQTKTFNMSIGDPIIGNLSARAYVIYGESIRSLEKVIEANFNVTLVELLDNSDIEITRLVYDPKKKSFYITVENTGSTDVYVSPELLDVLIDEVATNYGSDETVLIKKGKQYTFRIKVDLTDFDIENNAQIKVRAYYGEREDALIKIKQADFPFEFKGIDYTYYGLTAIIIILILLILLTMRRKKCKECGHVNPTRAKICEQCGNKL